MVLNAAPDSFRPRILATVVPLALLGAVATVLLVNNAPAPNRIQPNRIPPTDAHADKRACDIMRSMSPGGAFGELDNTTCGVFEEGATGSCCSFGKKKPCSQRAGVTVYAGPSSSAAPTVKIDSCNVPDPDQVFSPIWSASKMVSAALIMKLVEDGKLDLHAPLSDYIPWWTKDTNDPRAHVTLRHTITMTSGFAANPCAANVAIDANGKLGGIGSRSYTQEECAKKVYEESFGNFWTAEGEISTFTGMKGGCDGFAPLKGTAGTYVHSRDPVDSTAVQRDDVTPGAFWCYNEGHWIIAAQAAMSATGKATYQEVFAQYMAPQAGINTANCRWNWPSPQNVDPGGGLSCSVPGFAKFLGGYVANTYLSKSTTAEMEKVHAVFRAPLQLLPGWYISGYRLGMFATWDRITNTLSPLIAAGGNNGCLMAFQRPSNTRKKGYWAVLGRDGDQANHGFGAGITSKYWRGLAPEVVSLVSSGGGIANSISCNGMCV